MTMTREIKYSNPNKEIKIALVFLVIVLIIAWITSSGDNGDLDYEMIVYYFIILQTYRLFNWTIWKLAGGYKE